MPVPSTITDLSDSAASNFPQDSDSTGSTVASLPRNLSAIIKKQFIRGSDVAVVSSGSVTLNVEYSYFVVTGSGYNITGFSDAYNGRHVRMKFSGSLTLVNSASLILPNAANITTAAGDVAAFVNESAGVWRCMYFNRTTGIQIDASGNLGLGVTPSAWAAAGKVIEFAYPTYGMAANGGAFVSFNARESSANNWVYKSTDEANRLELNPDGGFRFFTAPSGTAGNAITFTQAMTLDASGNLLITSPAGLGYGTWSGGTVTQATSKSTAVTLNKPTGQITMNNAALAAGAKVTFAVNNSIVTSTDVPHVVAANNTPGDSARYRAECTYVGSGSFYITVENIGAASYSDNVYINFAIIKGSTA